MKTIWQCFALLTITPFAVHAQTRAPIDPGLAKAAFAEARQLSEREGGRLWGQLKLYGPMLLVDPGSRTVVANEPDAQGALRKEGDVYTGTLPASVVIADTPTEWAGKRWTMLRWPLGEEVFSRQVKLEHELFHRIQPELHLDAMDTPSLHLDTLQGRLWLQLEWRALAAALVGQGPARAQAIGDALAFRAHRQGLFPGAAEAERSLEIAEGVPEYAGLAAAAPDRDAARWRTIAKLADPDPTMSFVRSFAYTSGPAYGLLLDQGLPGWYRTLTRQSDLAALLASTRPGPAVVSVEQRAQVYGQSALLMAETDRAEKADAVKARYRALLVDGPTLRLPNAKTFAFNFNPSTLISLGEAGAVYPTFHVTDAWGVLEVKEGVLVPMDFSGATVVAPTDTQGTHLRGPGWTLDLAPGWRVVPAAKAGNYTVKMD